MIGRKEKIYRTSTHLYLIDSNKIILIYKGKNMAIRVVNILEQHIQSFDI